MEGRSSLVLIMAMVVVATMLHGSSAQTVHVVGDALGWTVPPGGDVAYRTWAATQVFVVGDSLVFNFTAGEHNVAEVSSEAYASCNSSTLMFISTVAPTTINLTTAGPRYFICGVPGHCSLGQRVTINVSSALAPQPATPPPSSAPSPSSRAAMTHIVGDSLGWTVPPGGPVAYRTWAMGQIFVVGDVLVFNFSNGAHNVIQVTRAEFNACNVSTTTTGPITTSPARITLNTAGEHYFICTFPQHCSLGQQLAINVNAAGATSPPPSSESGDTPPPETSTAPPPTSGGPTEPQPSTPSPTTAPSTPGNAAPSFGGAAFPLSLVTVALALLV